MILSAQTIRALDIINPCRNAFKDSWGNSGGLGPCGYDLTLDQDVLLKPGDFKLASTIEHFAMPNDVVGIIHDKSSLARRGVAVQNTVAEPGWRGYLTLELTNHNKPLPWWAWRRIPRATVDFHRGDAIAQIIFYRLDAATELPYDGKYQDQQRGPRPAKMRPEQPYV